jgi:hypothetical protein
LSTWLATLIYLRPASWASVAGYKSISGGLRRLADLCQGDLSPRTRFLLVADVTEAFHGVFEDLARGHAVQPLLGRTTALREIRFCCKPFAAVTPTDLVGLYPDLRWERAELLCKGELTPQFMAAHPLGYTV